MHNDIRTDVIYDMCLMPCDMCRRESGCLTRCPTVDARTHVRTHTHVHARTHMCTHAHTMIGGGGEGDSKIRAECCG